MIVRSTGARLAVPTLISVLVATTALATAGWSESRAEAAEGCDYSIDGINCWYGGSSSTVSTLPPYRYLRTTNDPVIGKCWYWSRYPPGLDALDTANDAEIIYTRFEYPECPGGGINVATRAWEVFRSFPLRPPAPAVRPTVGITNLASVVTSARAYPLRHVETLPDGRVLEVEAHVRRVPIDWGDGSGSVSYSSTTMFAAGATHAYDLKTCPESYRRHHPSGPRCHPTLEAYRVTVSFAWLGRYRTNGGIWTNLGTLHRSASFTYDVDEVIGFPVRP
jgi:hypothetical protein